MSYKESKYLSQFDMLYKHFHKKAFIFTKSYVYNDAIAEDIASESIIKLWESVKENRVKNPESFLLTILKNKALDYLKHEKIKEEAIKNIEQSTYDELNIRISMLEACDPQEVFSSEIQKIVTQTLLNLSAESRMVFELSRFDGKSHKEIAKELGVTTKNVEYHLTKVLKILRINLKDYLPKILFLFMFH